MNEMDENVLSDVLDAILKDQRSIDEEIKKEGILELGFRNINCWDDQHTIVLLTITSSLIVNDDFIDYLQTTDFFNQIETLVGNKNEEIKERTVMILTMCLKNDTFRIRCAEKNVQSCVINSFHKESTPFYYQSVSDFCQLLLHKKEYLEDGQINEIRQFYIRAICSQSTVIALDGLHCFYYFATKLLFNLSPTNEMLSRLSQLSHHKNKKLSSLALNFASFYQID